MLITGKYQNLGDENFVEYLKAMGVTEELIQRSSVEGLTVDVSEEGDKHVFKSNFGITFAYALNEEFDEPMLKGAKSIARREGDKIIVDTKSSDGLCTTRVFDFTDEGFTVVLTVGNVTAKRHYKKL